MTSAKAGTLDEAYERLHATGPEFDGYLSNHGPMAAEAMVRHGHDERVGSWLDGYVRRLEEFPRGLGPIGTDWQAALGDVRRVADWTEFFGRELAGQPWRQVLNDWWPRLLPGLVAAATHGVIRVGHAVRALTADGDDDVHVAELAHALAYWAARWQTLPAAHGGASAAAHTGRQASRQAGWQQDGSQQDGSQQDRWQQDGTPLKSLAAVPRIADQTGGIRERLPRLASLPDWPAVLNGISIPAAPGQVQARLAELVDAATLAYLRYGHGNGVMLVHSATAPGAVLRALPVLDTGLWGPSLAAAWAASSALTAVYAPAQPAPPGELPRAPAGDQPGEVADAAFARAVEHGDEHVIKFTDTAVDVFARTGDRDVIAAAFRAMQLITD
jgi:hypothetical protein